MHHYLFLKLYQESLKKRVIQMRTIWTIRREFIIVLAKTLIICYKTDFFFSLLTVRQSATQYPTQRELLSPLAMPVRFSIAYWANGRCCSIPAKPTGIKKEKDIHRLPENYKKLYKYFRRFYFHSFINITVIYQRLYM